MRVEDFSGDCSWDVPENRDEHTPNSRVPAVDVRAIARLCALTHIGRPLV
jgi:hypothetical protein